MDLCRRATRAAAPPLALFASTHQIFYKHRMNCARLPELNYPKVLERNYKRVTSLPAQSTHQTMYHLRLQIKRYGNE